MVAWPFLWVQLHPHREQSEAGAGRPPGLTVALALAGSAVTLVSVVRRFVRFSERQQLPCLLLVFSDNGLSFLLLQLPYVTSSI